MSAAKVDAELDQTIRHKEFVLAALRAAMARAKMMHADAESIGIALKNDLISPETAVRWTKLWGIDWLVGELPESVNRMDGVKRVEGK